MTDVKAMLKIAKGIIKLESDMLSKCAKLGTLLNKIAKSDCISVGLLAGDGIGVCVDNGNNCDSAKLSIIQKNGTITEEEILDITFM